MNLLILLIVSILPSEPVVIAECDAIEVNHYYDDSGKHVFDQLIYLNWYGESFECIGWQLMKDKTRVYNKEAHKAWDNSQLDKPEHLRIPYSPPFTPGYDLPRYNRKTKLYEAKYYKDVYGMNVVFHVKSQHLYETWTQYDPELTRRESLPKELRPLHPLNQDRQSEYVRKLFNKE